jgi:hypothetical protein
MKGYRIVLPAALLLFASACHHVDKTERLAALDDAYQAGLMTKDEYEAKKLAITGAASSSAPPSSGPVVIPAPAAPSSSPSVTAPALASGPTAQRTTALDQPARPLSTAPPTASSAAPAAAASSTAASPPSNLHANEPGPLPGCEDAEYKSGGQKGTEERFFAAPPDAVRRAALAALESLDFNIRKKSKKEIEGSRNRHLGAIVGAGGERVILTFEGSERRGTSGTRVTGRTKKHIVGYMAQRTWTDAVLAKMACKLSQSGR